MVDFNNQDLSLYEMFSQITRRVGRLSEIQSLVISTNDAHLYDEFDQVLNSVFRRTDNIYIKYKLQDLNDAKMNIHVGTSLYDMYFKELPNAIKASQVPFKRKKSEE